MTRTPIYLPLAKAALFVETAKHHGDLKGPLGSTADKGADAVKAGTDALAHITHHLQTDKLAGHLVHTAATEVEMWLQTARFRARKVLGDDHSAIDTLVGADLHGDNHTVTVIAQALRFVSILRMDADLRAQLRSGRMSIEDLLQRGNALMSRLLRLAEDDAHPHDTDADTHIAPVTAKLEAFIESAHGAASSALAAEPNLLGLLGVVTDDNAAPLGGTATNVTRHQRSHGPAPAPNPAPAAPGWSVGRQGRNNANIGKGY